MLKKARCVPLKSVLRNQTH